MNMSNFSQNVCKVSGSILPMYVTFKGDNGKYLQGVWQKRLPYLKFSGDDNADERAIYQIFSNDDGTIRIKSMYYGKFWRNGISWIWADTDESTSLTNSDCWFQAFKISTDNSTNVVALRSVGGYNKNYFCKRLTADRKVSCLNAYVRTMTKETRLEVTEPIISRKIYNVDYKLNDARIYNETIKAMATSTVANGSSEPNTINVTFKYTETTTKEWQASVSMKLDMKVNFKAGVPLIADGQVNVTTEFQENYVWGATTTNSSKVSASYGVIVKPKTKVKVSLLASMGTCDVPFSYTQQDVLVNGTANTQRLHDGLFTGANAYNFKAEIQEEIPTYND